MNIEEHITNLKKYIEEDFAFREPIKNMSDFDRYCWNHCKDIEAVLTAYEKEKEKNKELSNSYDKLAKECNEENRRCMLLAVENQDLKEKNKEHKQRITYLENKIFNQKQTIKEGGIKQC